MNIRTLIVVLLLTASTQGEENRTIEQSLSSLANIIIPRVDFSDDTTVTEAVNYLNIVLRAPDPPAPKEWKIRLEIQESAAKKKIKIVGRNLKLHQILGQIADAIDAEVIITRNGFIISHLTKKEAQ